VVPLETVEKKPSALLNLAQQKFNNLTVGEEIFLMKTDYGEYASLLLGVPDEDTNKNYIFKQSGRDGDFDPNKAEDWDKYRIIRSELIEWIFKNREAIELLSDDGIDLEFARIDGDLNLRNLKVNSPISFRNCTFTGRVDLSEGEFRSLSFDGCHMRQGMNAAYIRVDKYLRFADGFTSRGMVNLSGSCIEGDFYALEGHFINAGSICIVGEGMTIGGNARFQKGFEVQGAVMFGMANIQGAFNWCCMDPNSDFILDLRNARIRILSDDADSWPKKGNLSLNGMIYESIWEGTPINAKMRIDWLERQKEFRPQTYEQLAKCFQNMGFLEEAKEVLMAKEEKLTLARPLSERWLRFMTLGVFLGYGYDPWRLAYFGAASVVMGGFLFSLGFRKNLMSPVNDSRGQTKNNHPKFSALIYSIETFVPLLDLHQKKYWLPDARKGRTLRELAETFLGRWEFGRIAQRTSSILNWQLFRLQTGALLRWWFWAEIILGWIITTLLLAVLTGLIHTG